MSKNPELFRMDRRRFLTTFALGATAAPLLSLGRSAWAADAPPAAPDGAAASLCYSNKRVLRETDLQYLGAMRIPASGTYMDFSYGHMTGRRVGGQVQLLMVGSVTKGDPVYELADTGAYDPDPAKAPRMSLVRTWGDVYGSARRTWDRAGADRSLPGRRPGGIHWNEATQLLYWTFYETYNVTSEPDWCLGASRLESSGAVAFGPWRPSGDGKKGPWRCLRVTEHPSGQMLCGSSIQSGNSNSPWGPDMWVGNFPTQSTPAGVSAPDLPIQKYLTYYPMIGNVNPDGSFNGPIKAFRRPGDYFYEPNGGVQTQIDPLKNGGIGSWTELDGLGDATWIDLPDVHGVLFTGVFASGHVWYANAAGAERCSHGVAAPVGITGPVATDAWPFMIIYDPSDLEAVRAGQRTDYTINASQIINAQSKFGVVTAHPTTIGSARKIAGTYFDTATRRLYIVAPEADGTIPGIVVPLVHVFQIA